MVRALLAAAWDRSTRACNEHLPGRKRPGTCFPARLIFTHTHPNSFTFLCCGGLRRWNSAKQTSGRHKGSSRPGSRAPAEALDGPQPHRIADSARPSRLSRIDRTPEPRRALDRAAEMINAGLCWPANLCTTADMSGPRPNGSRENGRFRLPLALSRNATPQC